MSAKYSYSTYGPIRRDGLFGASGRIMHPHTYGKRTAYGKRTGWKQVGNTFDLGIYNTREEAKAAGRAWVAMKKAEEGIRAAGRARLRREQYDPALGRAA
jgi:hypothetical protein